MIAYIVDTVEYVKNNCFQSQLLREITKDQRIKVVEINQLQHIQTKNFVGAISVLKQRTLFQRVDYIKNCIGSTPIVVYDQDPWEAYRVDSPYVGAYERFKQNLNLRSIALTTKWWSDYVNTRGVPSIFVKMGVLPELCVNKQSNFNDRTIQLGFIGQLHPYRKNLFDELKKHNIEVTLLAGGFSYQDYLRNLQNIKINIHAEDLELTLDDRTKTNLSSGLWVKDLEAASQGCFSIRNVGEGFASYDLHELETVMLYNSIDQIPQLVERILSLNEQELNETTKFAVSHIKAQNNWAATAQKLIQQITEI